MTGNTYQTLADWDPALAIADLRISAAAYAGPADQKEAYVSPVYGDYAKGFVLTPVQGATREMFLSNFARQCRAIEDAEGNAELEPYEGMPHSFMTYGMGTPDDKAAMDTATRFWNRYLVPAALTK